MNMKRLIILCCFLALFIFNADSVCAQRSRKPAKKVLWQTSVDVSEPGLVTLGIRDKEGTLEKFSAAFVVTATAGKRKHRARTVGTNSSWAYVSFPGDFAPSTLRSGTYTIVFYGNGVVIGREKFKFRR